MVRVLELFAGAKIKVSSTGDVFSLDHLNKKRDGRIDNRKGHKLKTVLRKGYPAITISHNNIRKTYAVHRLVAMAFLPNPLKKQTVNHKNGIKTDNRVENLEWATHKENCTHREKNGLGNSNRDKLGRYV